MDPIIHLNVLPAILTGHDSQGHVGQVYEFKDLENAQSQGMHL